MDVLLQKLRNDGWLRRGYLLGTVVDETVVTLTRAGDVEIELMRNNS